MTLSLASLADVGDLSSAVDGDRLTYEDASGLWIPVTPGGGGFEAFDATVTYPSGDNGWTLVDELSPVVAATYVGSETSTPAADVALVYEFTVTGAQVDVTIGGASPGPVAVGLRASLSLVTALTGNRTIRASVTVNGTQRAYISRFVGSARLRAGFALPFACGEGDVVKFHVWATSGTDDIDLVSVCAHPMVLGAPDVDEPAGNIVLVRAGASAFTTSTLNTAPAALSGADLTGSTAESAYVRYSRANGQPSALAQSTSPLGTWALWAGLAASWPLEMAAADDDDDNSAGDPFVFQVRRFTALDFHYLVVDDPAV